MKSKNSNNEYKYLKGLIRRILLSVIFVLVSLIFINSSDANESLYEEYVLSDSLSFGSINKLYTEYFGDLNMPPVTTEPVFNEMLTFKSIDSYVDGYSLEVGTNYLVSSLNSGIVVYNGLKDDYGNTLIIQGVDGVDIWYSNINISGITMYDYVESGSLIGETISEDLIIVLIENGQFLDFEEYYEGL